MCARLRHAIHAVTTVGPVRAESVSWSLFRGLHPRLFTVFPLRGTLERSNLGESHWSNKWLNSMTVNQIQLALLHETDQDERSKLLDRLFDAEQMLTPLNKPRTELQKAVTHPHPVDLVELQRSLRADEMLLEYVLAEPRSFCLQVTRRTATVSALSAGRKQIEGLVDSYLGEIRSMKPGTDAAEKLYSVLLRPIRDEASKLRLNIVPDGKLNLLPFDSLQDPRGRYVLD